jgi:hypothetical protein
MAGCFVRGRAIASVLSTHAFAGKEILFACRSVQSNSAASGWRRGDYYQSRGLWSTQYFPKHQ